MAGGGNGASINEQAPTSLLMRLGRPDGQEVGVGDRKGGPELEGAGQQVPGSAAETPFRLRARETAEASQGAEGVGGAWGTPFGVCPLSGWPPGQFTFSVCLGEEVSPRIRGTCDTTAGVSQRTIVENGI